MDVDVLQELPNSDMRLRDNLNAVAYLRVAYTVSVYFLIEIMLEVLWTIFDPPTGLIIETAVAGRDCAPCGTFVNQKGN